MSQWWREAFRFVEGVQNALPMQSGRLCPHCEAYIPEPGQVDLRSSRQVLRLSESDIHKILNTPPACPNKFLETGIIPIVGDGFFDVSIFMDFFDAPKPVEKVGRYVETSAAYIANGSQHLGHIGDI